ncbi:uncharacterized protein LOC132753931 [Ruditapes philippinarum]|uniref:uncharacterized protein LOC132753931 n=1 Tax=Ruditapes philippinarum TaxID=129788 RepID=UPI00295B7FC8|nr:uncharacterized protein LOC132753931 [Ruditapes philippinarum]
MEAFVVVPDEVQNDSKESLLYNKYKEVETFVLQNDVIDWKQVEGKLRQILLEYENAKSDELRFGIKSMTWLKIFRTHERSIPEPIRNCLYEMFKEIENVLCMRRRTSDHTTTALIERYQTLGHDVLEMEIVNWEDIKKSLWQIIDDWKRELGFQGITVKDLDGKQQIIYHRLTFGNDLDYLINQVADKTGISRKEVILVFGENIVDPENEDLYIPDGAKLQLLPLEKGQNPPTNLTTFVRGIFNGLYVKIDRIFSYFPNVFKDTTRLLSEKDFVRICQLIGKGWGMLGIELGLTKVKLQQITEDKRNVASRIFEMLSQWSQTRKDGATAGQLLSAVMKSGVSCDFDELKRVLLVGL